MQVLPYVFTGLLLDDGRLLLETGKTVVKKISDLAIACFTLLLLQVVHRHGKRDAVGQTAINKLPVFCQELPRRTDGFAFLQ